MQAIEFFWAINCYKQDAGGGVGNEGVFCWRLRLGEFRGFEGDWRHGFFQLLMVFSWCRMGVGGVLGYGVCDGKVEDDLVGRCRC